MNPLSVLELAYVPVGLLFSLLGLPLMTRRVGPNRLYGVRLKSTLDDPTLWYEVNAYAGRELVWLGAAVSLTSLVLYLRPDHDPLGDLTACGAMVLVGVLIYRYRILRFVRRRTGGRADGR